MAALQEDRDEIVNAMRGETKSLGLLDTADNCWATFINKVKANLHVAFTASPVGEAFRVRSQVRQWLVSVAQELVSVHHGAELCCAAYFTEWLAEPLHR
jgi:hypothetical protein